MNLFVESVSGMQYMKADLSVINAWVKFEHLDAPVPFTATANDPEEHGKLLYQKLINGEYGAIAPYQG